MDSVIEAIRPQLEAQLLALDGMNGSMLAAMAIDRLRACGLELPRFSGTPLDQLEAALTSIIRPALMRLGEIGVEIWGSMTDPQMPANIQRLGAVVIGLSLAMKGVPLSVEATLPLLLACVHMKSAGRLGGS